MKSIAPFRHELGVLQAVVKAGKFPAHFRCDSENAAITWRARAYRANSILREIDAGKRGVPKEEGMSPFDNLKLTLSPDRFTVIITERLVEGLLIIGDDTVDVPPYESQTTESSFEDLGLDFSDLETFSESN